MNTAGKILLCAAIVVALGTGPVAVTWLLFWGPSDWLGEIQEYQTLAGSLVALFAAGLATIGVLLNISVQRENLRAQLETQQSVAAQQIAANQEATIRQIEAAETRSRAERDEQRRAVAYEQYQAQRRLALSLRGELVAIMRLLHIRLPKGVFSVFMDSPSFSKDREQPTLRIETDVATIFRANAGSIGVLPDRVPELLARFYGDLQTFIERVNGLDRIDRSALNAELRRLVVENMEKAQAEINDLTMELHKQLTAMNDSYFVWPPITPKNPSPGQILSLAQILEATEVNPLQVKEWLNRKMTPEEIASRASSQSH